ncbi:hypothetical protein BDU57DRAFT_571847 [Ampelomyces quisqualis]|uniref:Uncharacterized protein n=1 Tax=Ampelomyces quisqualis TaxID=50730 RepID=A0A6A5QVT3_AMPQU|nr:hypothetical protein BDU57DRAFT_571847 [Ampelomyces quisqualis]
MQSVTSKTITMVLNFSLYNAIVSSNMAEGNEIYATLRSAFSSILPPHLHIIIYHPTRDEKVRLAYSTLKEGAAYRITIAAEPAQGTGMSSSGTVKTRADIAAVREFWELPASHEILPSSIAPPGDAYTWPRRITDALRSFAGNSKCRHEAAVWFLVKEVEGRCAREEDSPAQLTAGDIQRAWKRMVASEHTAREALEVMTEAPVNRMFVGGLGEALAEVEEEEEEEEEEESTSGAVGDQSEWVFQLPTHFRR